MKCTSPPPPLLVPLVPTEPGPTEAGPTESGPACPADEGLGANEEPAGEGAARTSPPAVKSSRHIGEEVLNISASNRLRKLRRKEKRLKG